uniref:(northern house mosquito) hypothetical protein n=1 Tax=Culex pipiens TaxID=7175 RepID=A0A8D8FCG0_CULPI
MRRMITFLSFSRFRRSFPPDHVLEAGEEKVPLHDELITRDNPGRIHLEAETDLRPVCLLFRGALAAGCFSVSPPADWSDRTRSWFQSHCLHCVAVIPAPNKESR